MIICFFLFHVSVGSMWLSLLHCIYPLIWSAESGWWLQKSMGSPPSLHPGFSHGLCDGVSRYFFGEFCLSNKCQSAIGVLYALVKSLEAFSNYVGTVSGPKSSAHVVFELHYGCARLPRVHIFGHWLPVQNGPYHTMHTFSGNMTAPMITTTPGQSDFF